MASRFSTLNSRPRGKHAGFALLITVTLLAFLVILLVGLGAYTRVETAVAGNTQRQAQARQNALLALDIALGRLQKYAGADQRVTATADAFPNANGTHHYTGVWDTTQVAATTPATWLVSGNEVVKADGTVDPLAVTPANAPSSSAELVGKNTSGTANDVLAPLVALKVVGVPGQSANDTLTTGGTTVGRYAWWVGDQGVKAPVALSDPTASVNYAPWDSVELNSRIRQQISLGAGAADAIGAAVFEPRDANNTPLVANQKITAFNQLAFLKSPANAALGLSTAQKNFHRWSPNNFNVLASTTLGGLRQDLSLQPGLLGNAFAAWANYPGYMEPPVAVSGSSTSMTIEPDYGSDPLRRRYTFTPHVLDGNGSHQVGPVLSYFLISFNVRTVNESRAANAPLEVRARWMATLWNPYTSAVVPEDLQIEVTGLPATVRVVNDNPARTNPNVGQFSLASSATFGSPLVMSLPWPSAVVPSGVPTADRRSWLPGRIYTWRSAEDVTRAGPPSAGYASDFYSQTLNDGGAGVIRPLSGLTIADGDDDCHLQVTGSPNLTIAIYAVRASGRVRLGGGTSPDFVTNFSTTPQSASQSGYQFSYVFRLAESIDTPVAPGTWLTTDGRDLRRRTLPSECYVVAENGNDPAQYGGSYSKIRNPDRLLDRATNSYSYNEDVPVFELPRMPLLSLGALQHFRLVGRRPFMIGNSWGAGETLNSIPLGELFDRFYFSGLVDGVTPSTTAGGDLILPNPQMKALRLAAGARPNADDLRAVADARSAKYLLQGGAFNLNSTSTTAWAAVLRGVRFPAPQSFRYLDADSTFGTAADDAAQIIQSGDAQFFRFSQSAQESYKAEPGVAAGSETSAANTHLFRQGMRTLAAPQVSALASRIVALIAAKHGATDDAGGPFRSLQEFLSANALFTGGSGAGSRSLLEAAIEDAGINTTVAEFSSQFLTQGDIMTALAPVLFPRSDTFVIRTYGEAVNPVTAATEGRAWCEALVQRVPEYFDPTNEAEIAPSDSALTDLNKAYGRRFKVVSFRWLTRSDI